MSTPILYRAAAAWEVLRGRRPQTRSIFAGAVVDRLNGAWVSSCLPPNDELRGDLRIMRGRARQICRDNPYAERYLQLLVDNTLGDAGITLDAQYRDRSGKLDKALNDQVEGAWDDYCSGPVTVDGSQDFYTWSDLMLESAAKDGEIFTRVYQGFPNEHGLALQAIDPDLVDETYIRAASPRNNEIRLGVEVDRIGRRLGYWVREDSRYMGVAGSGRMYFVPAREMLHFGRPRRANQTRYYTWFHSVMEDLHQISEYIVSELVASRLASSACGVWEDANPDLPGADGSTPEQAAQGKRIEAEPGIFLDAPTGKKLSSWIPGHPTDAFPEFVKSAIRRFASGMGCSYQSVANDHSDSSYSSDRSGLLMERRRWMKVQDVWIRGYLQPIFNSWLEMAVLKGVLPPEVLPGRGIAAPVEWHPPRWPWVDPRNDAQAEVLKLQWNLTSLQRIHKAQGTELETILEEKAKAQEMADQLGVDLEPVMPGTAAATADDEPATNGNGNTAKAKPARAPKSRIGVGV